MTESDDPLLTYADDLYALPIAEFTAARDLLVREHRSDKAFAARLKALKKPSVAAWVVNLLVRRDPDQVDQVLEVGAALRDAQANLDAEQMREFTKQRRQLTAAVTTVARRLARAEGSKVTQAVADQVESTLTAAMLDAEAARAMRSGLLVRGLDASGMGEVDLDGAIATPEALGFSASARLATTAAAEDDPRHGIHVVPDPEAEEKARAAADQRLAEAERARDEALASNNDADAAVERLQARTLQVQSEIDELQSRIAALESQLEEIDDELDEAEALQEEAVEELARAENDLAAARAVRDKLG